MGPNLIGRKFQVKNFPSHTSVSGIFPCSSVCIKTFYRLGIASLYRFSSNEMDPKVAKLLEGKSDEDRIKAIAFSFGCLLTRPTANSPPDAPMKGKNLKLRSLHRTIFELILSWCTIPSQMNGERRRSREANRNIPLRNWATKKIVQVLTENFIHFIYLLLNLFVRRRATKSDCALEASALTRGFRIAMSFRVQRKIFIWFNLFFRMMNERRVFTQGDQVFLWWFILYLKPTRNWARSWMIFHSGSTADASNFVKSKISRNKLRL